MLFVGHVFSSFDFRMPREYLQRKHRLRVRGAILIEQRNRNDTGSIVIDFRAEGFYFRVGHPLTKQARVNAGEHTVHIDNAKRKREPERKQPLRSPS